MSCALTLSLCLQTGLNQRFVHLSESCIPLYPPALLYMQLLHEQKSRVHVQNPSRCDLLLATFTVLHHEPCRHSMDLCPYVSEVRCAFPLCHITVLCPRAGSCSG